MERDDVAELMRRATHLEALVACIIATSDRGDAAMALWERLQKRGDDLAIAMPVPDPDVTEFQATAKVVRMLVKGIRAFAKRPPDR